jgi:ribosomal protein L37AE/L43A
MRVDVSRLSVVKIIVETLSEKDEKGVAPTPLSGIRVGRRLSKRWIAERRPFECAVCAKSFTQRSGLRAHARHHLPRHRRALALHRCRACGKVFLYGSGTHLLSMLSHDTLSKLRLKNR